MDRNTDDKKQLIYNLATYINKVVYIKFVGGKDIVGKLVGFDNIQNLVVADPGLKQCAWAYKKHVICLAHSIISIGLGYPQNAGVMK